MKMITLFIYCSLNRLPMVGSYVCISWVNRNTFNVTITRKLIVSYMYFDFFFCIYMHIYTYGNVNKMCKVSVILLILHSIFKLFLFHLCIIAHLFPQKGQVPHECPVQENDTCSAVERTWVTVAISREGCTAV